MENIVSSSSSVPLAVPPVIRLRKKARVSTGASTDDVDGELDSQSAAREDGVFEALSSEELQQARDDYQVQIERMSDRGLLEHIALETYDLKMSLERMARNQNRGNSGGSVAKRMTLAPRRQRSDVIIAPINRTSDQIYFEEEFQKLRLAFTNSTALTGAFLVAPSAIFLQLKSSNTNAGLNAVLNSQFFSEKHFINSLNTDFNQKRDSVMSNAPTNQMLIFPHLTPQVSFWDYDQSEQFKTLLTRISKIFNMPVSSISLPLVFVMTMRYILPNARRGSGPDSPVHQEYRKCYHGLKDLLESGKIPPTGIRVADGATFHFSEMMARSEDPSLLFSAGRLQYYCDMIVEKFASTRNVAT